MTESKIFVVKVARFDAGKVENGEFSEVTLTGRASVPISESSGTVGAHDSGDSSG
jgi:hypothetical protein